MNGTSPARSVAGLLLPVLDVSSTLLQVVFQVVFEMFSLASLVSLPTGQFTVDLLGKPGRGHTYNVTSPTTLVLDTDGLDTYK